MRTICLFLSNYGRNTDLIVHIYACQVGEAGGGVKGHLFVFRPLGSMNHPSTQLPESFVCFIVSVQIWAEGILCLSVYEAAIIGRSSTFYYYLAHRFVR